jgi:hypothetical protein
MCKPKVALDREILQGIEDILFEKFSPLIPNLLSPLDLETAVNGCDDDPFIRRINISTAAGYGTPGKKTKYTTRVVDANRTIDEPNDDIKRAVISIIDCYLQGECYHPVFTAQLKDEPRDRKKVSEGKTRIFYSTPYAFLIAQRMFLAPFYSLMVEKSASFYTALGIDMHRDAQELFDRLSSFSTNILEGDYSGYDVSMPIGIGRTVNRLVCRLLAETKYNDEALTVVSGILGDLLYPHVSFIGESLCFPGLQPSGKYATAEDNSLRNLVIQMYVWSKQGNELSEFFDHVLPVTYGDDLLAAVRDKPSFNAVSYAVTCEHETGLGFTASDKGEVTTEYITPKDMSFLKRSFTVHPTLKRVVAPLDLDSIYKMLEWRLPSTSVSEETQMEQTLCSALRELFFHVDKPTFETIRVTLAQILQEAYGNYSFEIVQYDTILEDLCPQFMVVGGGRQQSTGEIVTESWARTGNLANVINFRVVKPYADGTFGRVLYRSSQWPAFEKMRDTIMELELELKIFDSEMEAFSSPVRGATYR